MLGVGGRREGWVCQVGWKGEESVFGGKEESVLDQCVLSVRGEGCRVCNV